MSPVASGSTNQSGGQLAERYANALYAQADETGALDQTVSEMDSLGKLIDQSPEFRRLIESPLMTHEETLDLMEVLDTIRGQIGLSYDADLAP